MWCPMAYSATLPLYPGTSTKALYFGLTGSSKPQTPFLDQIVPRLEYSFLNNILRFDPQTSAPTSKNVMEGVGLL